MPRLIQLIYGSNPSRGSFDRAEINSRRPLEPFFLNRISRTVSMLYPQLHTGRHSGAAPRSRHSGAAPQVVILSAAKNPRIGLCLFLFVILSEAQNLCRCLYCAAAPSGEPSKPHRMNNFHQLAQNRSFSASTRSKASFSPLTLMS